MKADRNICIIVAFLSLLSFKSHSQDFTFVFYNVENLFDIYDDEHINDEEFTPEGQKNWNYDRYIEKIDHISRVLTGIGEWKLPAIVGLCEIENRKVLLDLIDHRLLKEQDYEVIHQNSPDRRGIDVALLYDKNVFSPLVSVWYEIRFKTDTGLRTRDILYVKGEIYQKDTIHVFINHWPSRWGGIEATVPKRVETARQLKEVTDSIFAADNEANILIAGDFNDTPADSSLIKVLNAADDLGEGAEYLINLMYPIHMEGKEGTLKYRENWEIYDQIIVSSSLMKLENSRLSLSGPYIYRPDFLITEDERYLGMKPFRTYSGPKYHGGFSDHLPVFVRFESY